MSNNRVQPLHEIIEHLTSSGCRNLTSQLVSSSAHPVSRGGFGDVYRGALDDQRKVAIKALRVSLGVEDELDKVPKHAARELYTWSKCNHPNVLPLLGLVEFQGQIRMISLWLENGSLPLYLDKHPDIDRCSMSVLVCKGLEYLHSIGVVHGDLKGQNILVSNDQMPMITDFGNAVLQQGTLMFTETTNAPQFTPRWTAPELMDDGVRQSREADVYALGMTILEIMTGKVPYYYKSSVVALFRTILFDKEIPKRPEENIPSTNQHGDVLWSLLQGCWEYEPEKRPSATEVAKIVRQSRMHTRRFG
ncbi:hypothetical protein FRC08_016878 [Ceratobasidium sp. 394]|nr:hypothetical protein FRC08_016878 [Ceratobasidium sp. 394]